jgi:hypothetical protein
VGRKLAVRSLLVTKLPPPNWLVSPEKQNPRINGP